MKTKIIQRNWQYRVHKTKTKKTKTTQRNWQYKVHKTKKTNKNTKQYVLDTTMRGKNNINNVNKTHAFPQTT
jgi:hypothetical protein